MYDLISVGRNGKKAAAVLRDIPEEIRNRAIERMADALRENSIAILESNRTDMEIGRRSGSRASKMRSLTLTGIQIGELADQVAMICSMPSPRFIAENENLLPDGSLIQEMREPIGVVALVSEASPRMTVTLAAMCIKTGNVLAVSGGQSAYGTNRVLLSIIAEALRESGLPDNCVQNIDDVSEETTKRFITLDEYFDLLIPVGDSAFINRVVPMTTLPLLVPGVGIKHLYIDKNAKRNTAVELASGGADTLLIHREASMLMPAIKAELSNNGISIVGCSETARLLQVPVAREDDWSDDGAADTVTVKIVESIEDAIEHIARYSGHVADGIVTDNDDTAQKFARAVDSALICVNAPVVSDSVGIGFSHRKNARGPITLESLTNIKYVVTG